MNEIEAASVFYTLSTIAQVLAAFMALGSVFVFFKVNEDKQEMKLMAYASIVTLKSYDANSSLLEDYINRLNKNYENGSINGVIQILNSVIDSFIVLPSDGPDICSTAMLHRDMLILIRKRIDRLLRLVKISIFSGVLAIFFCITGLAFVPIIPYFFLVLLIIVLIVLALVSLLMMVWIIFYSLNNKKTGYDV